MCSLCGNLNHQNYNNQSQYNAHQSKVQSESNYPQEDWETEFYKAFGTRDKFIEMPSASPQHKLTQLDFYDSLKQFILSLLKSQEQKVMKGLIDKVKSKMASAAKDVIDQEYEDNYCRFRNETLEEVIELIEEKCE